MLYAESCLSGRAYIDTNLVEIHAEMSELLDKQVYVLNEYFKYKFRDSHGGHASPRKVCDKNETKKEKNDGRVKNFLMTGRTLYGCC